MSTVARVSRNVQLGLSFAAILMLATTSIWAKDSVSFTEKYADKVVSDAQGGYGTIPTGSFTFKASSKITADEVPDTTQDIPVVITIGSWSADGLVIPAASKPTTSAKATFQLTHQVCNADGDKCKDVKHGTITVSGNRTSFTVSVSASTGQDAQGDSLEASPSASDIASSLSSGDKQTIKAADGQTFTVSVDAGDGVIHRDWTLVITGSDSKKTVTKGKGDNATDFDLATVSISGKLQ